MYCKQCGNAVPDGVKFCTFCGAKLDEPAAAPKPVPQKRKALILPAIFAALSMLIFLYSAGNIARFIVREHLYNASLFGSVCGSVLMAAAALLVFLFCIAQVRKGKTSLFGLACLLIVLRFVLIIAIALLQSLPPFRHVRAASAASSLSSMFVDWALELAASVLLVIEAIGAFKGKINKPVGIVAACVLIVNTFVSNTASLRTVVGWLGILLSLLLPLAILLVAILHKPAKQ